MRKLIIASSLLAMAMPLSAQMRGMDMTKEIHGSGKLPDGWMVRFDPPRGRGAAATLSQVDVKAEGKAMHFQTGPAGIYYNPKDHGSGEFYISATFTAKKSNTHEAYGIFLGGENLQDSTQSYLYFEVRPGMGDSVFVQHRNGDNARKMDMILPWTTTNGVAHVDDPTDGHSSNTLMIHVAKDTLHFIVNDKLVKAIAKSDLKGAKIDGQTGLRVNHSTDVTVEWKGVGK